MADNKYIDVDSALSRVGGNRGLYDKLLGKFEGSVDMDGFNSAISAGDYKTAGEIAHAAKGIAGNLSLTAFFDQCVIVMDQLRDGSYDENEVAKFVQLFEETKTAIDELLNS